MNPAKKSLGQHWLEDKQILDSICEAGNVKASDTVLEVGPGQGSLTNVLLKTGAKVVAVELDDDLAVKLKKTIKSKNLTLINENILDFDLTSLPVGYKVVANIPYYLTSNLIRTLSESINPPETIVLLVQKEVAERICAGPGQMSLLSVSAQVYFECKTGIVVTSDKFSPPPKVDSQVVQMVRKSEPMITDDNKKHFFRIVKAGFSSRRKTLLNSLSGGLDRPKPEIDKLLDAAFINPASRPQELSLTDWIRLAELVD